MSNDDVYQKIQLQGDEFNGLIGNFLGGGGGGDLGNLAGQLLGGGGGNSGGGAGATGGGAGNSGSAGGSGGTGAMVTRLLGSCIGKCAGGNRGNDEDGAGNANNRRPAAGDNDGGDFGNLIGGLMGGGGGGGNRGGGGYDNDDYGGGGQEQKKKKKSGIGGMLLDGIGGIFNKKKKQKQPSYDDNRGGGGGSSGGGGGFGDVLGGLMGGGDGKGGVDPAALIGGLSGLIGGGGNSGSRGNAGGSNFNTSAGGFQGMAVDMFSKLAGNLGHKYLGIDPNTGRILGSIAGNALFNLGGKDNGLGNIGKLILDNIITGKFKRKVDPYVPPVDPSGPARPLGPSGPGPRPKPQPGQGQDFVSLRQSAIDNRQLFEDPMFPATDSSMFYSRAPPRRIEWRRPGEICREPCLFVEGHSRFDVIQGELGDCWLLAATAILTMRDELFYRVVPPDQSFTENYAGIFHFQFWQYGDWVDVVIDDRLPTSNGELMYMHSKANDEFWSALLEKAYAKMHGSYEALKGGTTSEALADFTGGLTEFYDLRQNTPNNLEQLMMRSNEMGGMMGCSIEADPRQYEARLPNGLVRGHAYSITAMKSVRHPKYGNVILLRVRNPWGNEQEWNGAWSDNWGGWSDVASSDKQDMELTRAHDGEFWISYDDFRREFEKLEICNLGPDVLGEVQEMTGVSFNPKLTWNSATHDGAWIANRTAGGCRNFLDTFPNNPQFKISMQDADPDDDDELCTCVLAVTQKYRRQLRAKGLDMLSIGFAVYEADANNPLSSSFFSRNKAVARSPVFINLREVTTRCRLPPGGYVMIPTTFDPNEEGEFQVRIFTTGLLQSNQL